MRWVTRENCHVDRTACAWLIRRYIDPEAEFLFVADPSRLPPDATPFDITGQAFSHHDGASTFEVMVRHYDLAQPGLEALGRVVHEADIEDERYDAPEAPGLDAIIRGMGEVLPDAELLAATATLFDGLLAYLAARD
jgi:hypothetical protein